MVYCKTLKLPLFSVVLVREGSVVILTTCDSLLQAEHAAEEYMAVHADDGTDIHVCESRVRVYEDRLKFWAN